jgi:hypothetical protein
MKGIYYIENTINEFASSIQGYFTSLDDAMEALKSCSDWYRSEGTGEIYFTEFGLNGKTTLVYKK